MAWVFPGFNFEPFFFVQSVILAMSLFILSIVSFNCFLGIHVELLVNDEKIKFQSFTEPAVGTLVEGARLYNSSYEKFKPLEEKYVEIFHGSLSANQPFIFIPNHKLKFKGEVFILSNKKGEILKIYLKNLLNKENQLQCK